MKMIYSNSLDVMINKGFTVGKKHYTWDDSDCLWYYDETDDDWFDFIPQNAILD